MVITFNSFSDLLQTHVSVTKIFSAMYLSVILFKNFFFSPKAKSLERRKRYQKGGVWGSWGRGLLRNMDPLAKIGVASTAVIAGAATYIIGKDYYKNKQSSGFLIFKITLKVEILLPVFEHVLAIGEQTTWTWAWEKF